MKRILLVTSLFIGSLYAQELTIEASTKLRNYNHTPSGKLKHKRLMQRMATIDESRAKELAKEGCKELFKTIKLKHHNRRLFYSISTKGCHIKVDALDGSIIEEEKK